MDSDAGQIRAGFSTNPLEERGTGFELWSVYFGGCSPACLAAPSGSWNFALAAGVWLSDNELASRTYKLCSYAAHPSFRY